MCPVTGEDCLKPLGSTGSDVGGGPSSQHRGIIRPLSGLKRIPLHSYAFANCFLCAGNFCPKSVRWGTSGQRRNEERQALTRLWSPVSSPFLRPVPQGPTGEGTPGVEGRQGHITECQALSYFSRLWLSQFGDTLPRSTPACWVATRPNWPPQVGGYQGAPMPPLTLLCPEQPLLMATSVPPEPELSFRTLLNTVPASSQRESLPPSGHFCEFSTYRNSTSKSNQKTSLDRPILKETEDSHVWASAYSDHNGGPF